MVRVSGEIDPELAGWIDKQSGSSRIEKIRNVLRDSKNWFNKNTFRELIFLFLGAFLALAITWATDATPPIFVSSIPSDGQTLEPIELENGLIFAFQSGGVWGLEPDMNFILTSNGKMTNSVFPVNSVFKPSISWEEGSYMVRVTAKSDAPLHKQMSKIISFDVVKAPEILAKVEDYRYNENIKLYWNPKGNCNQAGCTQGIVWKKSFRQSIVQILNGNNKEIKNLNLTLFYKGTVFAVNNLDFPKTYCTVNAAPVIIITPDSQTTKSPLDLDYVDKDTSFSGDSWVTVFCPTLPKNQNFGMIVYYDTTAAVTEDGFDSYRGSFYWLKGNNIVERQIGFEHSYSSTPKQ